MTLIAAMSMDLLWHNALGAIPLAIVVAVICRFVRCRPSTRHALWLIVLLALLAPPLAPALNFADEVGTPRLFASMREGNPESSSQPPASPGVGSLTPTNRPSVAPPTNNDAAREAQPRTSAPAKPVFDQPAPFSYWTQTSLTPESAASTASEGSPDPLRGPASHPSPSVAGSGRPASTPSACDSGASVASNVEPRSIEASATPALATVTIPWLNLSIPDIAKPVTSEPPAISTVPPRESLARSALVAPAPAPPSASTDVPSFSAVQTAIEWRDWLVRVAAVRDALVSLAPIPGSMWALGVAMIMLVMLVRIWRFRRLLRRAVPADQHVTALVRECAGAIGLRSVPRTLMTPRQVSPLVWCGLQRVLLLPEHLWQDLDDAGRRAVLLHELAHVRRRDHWVCWIEMVVCTVYWWNPMAWWVRHRLRDEADYCCDAWVTAVLPRSRTAYARALLSTRQYLNVNPSRTDTPSMALGATSARTKRFARRLTMVMTERSAPRLSMCGSALALLLAGGVWLATPLWACPPEESSGPSAQAAAVAQKAEKAAKEKAVAAKEKAAAAAKSAAATGEKAAKAALEKAAAAAAAGDKAAKAELEKLAVALKAAQGGTKADKEKIEKALTEVHASMGREVKVPYTVVTPSGEKIDVVTVPGSTYEQHMAGRAPTGVIAQAAPSGQSLRQTVTARGGGQGGGDLEARINRLEERMDRLTQHIEALLSGGGQHPMAGGGAGMAAHPRNATPPPELPRTPEPPAPPSAPRARRAPGGGGAAMAPAGPNAPHPGAPGLGGRAVIAEPAEVADGGEEIVRFYELPQEKANALFEFMRRDDVPVMVAQRDGGIEVHGTAQQHRIFAAFVKLIHPEARIENIEGMAAPAGMGEREMLARERAVAGARERQTQLAQDQRAQAQTRMRDARTQLERARKQQGDELRRAGEQQRRQMEQQRKELQKQREQMQKQIEDLTRKQEELQKKAEDLRAKAEKAGDAEREQLEAQADAIEAQADALEAQADQVEAQADAQMEAMEAQLDAQQEALESQIEAQQEAIEAELEAQQERLEAEFEAQQERLEAELDAQREALEKEADLTTPTPPPAPDAPKSASTPRPPTVR